MDTPALLQKFATSNFLITCDNWFFAPDGKSYRAVWGKVKICKDDETLGIKTNLKSSNWYAVIGDGDKMVIVAGCQIHYATICQQAPHTGDVSEKRISDSLAKDYQITRETTIYLAQ